MNIGASTQEVDDCETYDGISTSDRVNTVAGVVHLEDETTLCADVTGHAKGTIASADGLEDLKKVLARPRAYARGSISTGVGNLINVPFFDRASWRAAIGALQFDRMIGMAGFRATIVARVVVTATPFHQGILNLCWQYGVGNTPLVNSRRGLYQATSVNLPHVKLDLAENSEVELRIPFISPYEFIPINDLQESGYFTQFYGQLSITRLTDFRLAGTQVSPTYVLYLSLEDVEFIGAAPFEMGTVTLQAGGTAADKEASVAGIASSVLGSAAKGVASMVKKSVSTDSKSKGKLSSLLSTASKASAVASLVPSFTPIAGPTTWFLASASKAAAAFGFSKPVVETTVERVAQTDYRGESHIDLPNPAFVAGPFQTNKLRTDGTVGSVEEDHMAFDYIFSKPALISRRLWDSTVAAGDILYAGHVSPSAFWYRESTTGRADSISLPANASLTTNAFIPSHLMYVGSNFRNWRGTLVFTFQFSKTKMHGGRVLATFTPDPVSVASAAPLSSTVVAPVVNTGKVDLFGYTKMFDLTDSSTFDFEVPFMYPEPYAPYYGRTGTITLHCISPLNSPTNASTTIDMLTYVYAKPGFEFAVVKPSVLDATNPRTNNVSGGIYQQAGGVIADDNASEYVVGEKFNSVKQLAMIPDWHVFDQANLTSLDVTLAPYFKRDYVPAVTGATALPNTSTATWFGSKSGRMAEMFSFCNGSTNWTIINDAPGGAGYVCTIYSEPQENGNAVTGFGSAYNSAAAVTSGYQWSETRGSVRVVVPAYTRVLRVPFAAAQFVLGANQASGPGLLTYSGDFTGSQTEVRLRNTSGAARRVALGRAAGDDAYFSQYVGPPVCAFFQSTQSVSPNPSATNF